MSRFFWDLYDTTANSSDDETIGFPLYDDYAMSFAQIFYTWDEFTPGTGNRDRNESDDEGVNAWDFEHYEPDAYEMLEHNCLYYQDQG